jgi:hypothetical protein
MKNVVAISQPGFPGMVEDSTRITRATPTPTALVVAATRHIAFLRRTAFVKMWVIMKAPTWRKLRRLRELVPLQSARLILGIGFSSTALAGICRRAFGGSHKAGFAGAVPQTGLTIQTDSSQCQDGL